MTLKLREHDRLTHVATTTPRWLSHVAPLAKAPAADATHTLGIFPGEGCGPELMAATMKVLDAIEHVADLRIARRFGGEIGLRASGVTDGEITAEAAAFCDNVFSAGGAIISGAAGGRFVYDLRRRFDLFCKLVPLKPDPNLRHATRLKPDVLADVDILVVRDNSGGIYQGTWTDRHDANRGDIAEQTFSYDEEQVRSILCAGARLAASRRGRMHVVIKDGGVPTISNLWRRCAHESAAETRVQLEVINADHAAYRLIQHPQDFDVVITPNMIGDILADLGAVLLGSRGLSFSANISPLGHAVYQTGHGAAYDLQGTDRANPVAQILALAMLLRESFGCTSEAALIERAVSAVWHAGWRTADLAEADCRIAGTQRLGELVAQAVIVLSETPVSS